MPLRMRRSASSMRPSRGGPAAGGDQWHDVSAVPQPRAITISATTRRNPKACCRGTAKLVYRAEPRTAAVWFLCARLQGGWVQPRPRRMHRRAPGLRARQRGGDHADQRHPVRRRNQQFLRNRRKGDAVQPQAAVERDAVLPEVQGLPAQHVQRPGVRRRLGARRYQQRRRCRFRLDRDVQFTFQGGVTLPTRATI